MQSKRSYNNSVFIEENTDSKIDSIVPYNYKKRREELNAVVKNHIDDERTLELLMTNIKITHF